MKRLLALLLTGGLLLVGFVIFWGRSDGRDHCAYHHLQQSRR